MLFNKAQQVNAKLYELIVDKKVLKSKVDSFDEVLNAFYLSDDEQTVKVVLAWTKSLFTMFREEMFGNLDKFIKHFTVILIKNKNKVVS